MTAATENPLTNRQQAILEFIHDEITRRNRVPSLKEIGEHFSIRNPNGVRSHLLSLQRKGYLDREPDKARSLRLIAVPGRFAGMIAALKQKLWAHKRYFVHLPLAMSFVTRKGYHFFEGPFANELEKIIRKVAANHDWEIEELSIRSDGFTVQLLASPDHSPERIARNFKTATLALALRHPFHFHGKGIWATGFVATADARLLDDLLAHYRESLKTAPDKESEET